MHLVAIAWLYVALLMGAVEATHINGTVLGGIITFVLYGLLPVALVLYILGAPARRKALKRREREAFERERNTSVAAAPAENTLRVAPEPDEGAER